MEHEEVPYTPVANAHNSKALRATVHKSLGIIVSKSVARSMLAELQGSSIVAELAEYATLPGYIEDLQKQDPEVQYFINDICD